MPDHIVTIVIGTLLAIIGYLINDKLSGIKDALRDLKEEISKLNEMYHDHEIRLQKLEDNI
jgi:hypothetical protein